MDGLGWGVGGILRKQGVRVIEFRGGSASEIDPKEYANKRAEAYGEVAKRLDPDGLWRSVPFAIPDDPELRAELTAPEKIYIGKDGLKYRITPKQSKPNVKDVQSIHKKLKRSPDKGDSLVYFNCGLKDKGQDLGDWLESGAF